MAGVRSDDHGRHIPVVLSISVAGYVPLIARSLARIERALNIEHHEQEHLMGIAQDILAAENTEAAAVTALGSAVAQAVAQMAAASQQIADLIANGSLSDDDKAALQSALDTANASTTALGASLDEVNAALTPAAPSASDGDEGPPAVDASAE